LFSSIYHVSYLTESNASAIEFYRKLFGAEVLSEVVSASGSKMAFLKIGDTEVELIESPQRVRDAGKGSIIFDHVGYCVPDIDAAVAELRAKGVKFVTEAPYTNPRGHRLIYLDSSTTEGVRVHLTQVEQ